MTENAKQELTLAALGILREQVEARVIHYKAELETSAELDAVTAQVVKQVQELQRAAVRDPSFVRDPNLIEQAHIGTLEDLLRTVLIKDKNFVTRYIQPIGKRLAKLFFERELHQKSTKDRDKIIHHPEQGLFYLLKRYHNRLRTEIDCFDYASDAVREGTLQLLAKTERELQVGFLSRRSPELNSVLSTYTDVLVEFFQKHLPERLPQMSRITIRNARTARQPDSVPYKVHPGCFGAFRAEWERVLMTQMIHFCGDELVARLQRGTAHIREDTLDFFSDPHIYSETCGVICDGLYDRLCMDGFLDLPVDWRLQISAQR